jgi:hypothetical protein
MDEGRKRVLLIAASILAGAPSFAVRRVGILAIIAAEKILRRIDSRWPKHEYDRSF